MCRSALCRRWDGALFGDLQCTKYPGDRLSRLPELGNRWMKPRLTLGSGDPDTVLGQYLFEAADVVGLTASEIQQRHFACLEVEFLRNPEPQRPAGNAEAGWDSRRSGLIWHLDQPSARGKIDCEACAGSEQQYLPEVIGPGGGLVAYPCRSCRRCRLQPSLQ